MRVPFLSVRLSPALLVGSLLACAGCVVETGPYAAPPPPPPPSAPPTPIVIEQPGLSDDAIVVVYVDVLDRRPSSREVWEWHERARSYPTAPDDIRRALLASPECSALVPEEVIRRAYRDIHRRDPRPDEVGYFRHEMVDEHWTPGRIRTAIAQRREEMPHDVDDQREWAPRPRDDDRDDRRFDRRDDRRMPSPDAIIEQAFGDLLERKPDAAGRDHYRQLLAQGYTEQQIRDRIRQSEEYRVTLPDSKTRRAYRKILGRDPDASGLESYRRKIVDHGWTEQDVENDLRKSAEYRNRKGAGK